MTGSGKTFSMQGTASSPGIIPLAITDIFSFIRESPQREFLLRVSYLEIYNERINDLLSTYTMKPGQKEEEIKLRQDSRRGVYASPLKEEIVQSPTQLLRVIARGDQRRRTSSTQYNLRSSRSHAVVQIVVESRERNAVGAPVNKRNAMLPGGVRISTLSLIDLAGSERAAETKERRTEGGHINKSLLTLGTVISKLSATKDAVDKDHKHIPYRDSKLTRLLQGALSGESLISILCTVQLGNNTIETLNTLKFAARARNNIVSHAKKAKEGFDANDPGSRGLLEMYRTEILQLRKDLEAQKKQSEKMREDEEEKAKEAVAEARHEEHMLEMQLARTALKERIDHLNKLIISSKSAGVNNRKSAYGATPKRLSSSSTIASTYSKRTSRGRQDSDSSLARLDNNSTYSIGRASSMGSEIYDDEGSPIISDEELDADEDKIALQQQVTKLQADMAERDQYIITLEERLNRARKASRSRGRNKSSELLRDTARGWETVVNEKDAEIAELKEKLEDKDRMVVALRNMNKKRDAATSSMATPGQFAISTSAHASGQNTRNATSRSSSLEIVPPLPAGSISELLARRKASGIVSLRPRTSPSPAATNFLDVQGSIPSSTYGTTQPSVMSSPPTTPSSFPSPPTHQGTFFSTRRLSLSSQEGDILPSKVRPSSLSPVISRPNSAGRSHSRNKPHRRSISSAGPIPLQLASVLPSSPTLPKTPPPPPKSEKRVSKQVPSTNGNQQGLSDSSPELGKAQVVIPGTPKQTLKHAGDLVREAIENREAKSPNIVLEEERKTSMRAEFVGEAF
jgi:centromeric protein E